jgi:hypothetical protein
VRPQGRDLGGAEGALQPWRRIGSLAPAADDSQYFEEIDRDERRGVAGDRTETCARAYDRFVIKVSKAEPPSTELIMSLSSTFWI